MIQRLGTALALCILGFTSVLPGFGTALVAHAQQAPGVQPFADLSKIADDVYVWRYNGYTTLFIVTDEGVIATDPSGMTNPRGGAELFKATIASVTEQPVVYLIYSHGNPDHAFGADVFADTATLIGTPEAAEKLAALNSDRHPVPTMLVTDTTHLELGGAAIDLYHVGNTQGNDHLILHYPARRILYAVDFIPVNRLPFRDLGGAASIDDWQAALTRIEAMDWDILVPGHGNLGNKATLQSVRAYFQDLEASIRSARAAGLADNSPEMVAAVRADMAPKYGSWESFENWLPENVTGVIRAWASQ